MGRLYLVFALTIALLLGSRTGLAGTTEVQIHLITMGPGDHLYTRAGHAALMVADLDNGAPTGTTIYNYGDTDWDDRLLFVKFLRGELIFFLTESQTLLQTVNDYGLRQGRSVYRQRLNLSPEQAALLKRRLKEGSAVGKREYLFHHYRAACTTRITDLLDDVLGGRLRAELATRNGPQTARDYQEMIYSGHYLTAIGGDLFVGRLHDQPFNQYDSTSYPERMREYLQTIMVPSPSGSGEKVPLAEPPVALVERKEPLVLKKSWFTHYLWGACIALLVGYGASAYRRAGKAPEEAAQVILPAALVSGLAGFIIFALIVLSRVPELRQNELILLFWPTDLWLAYRARRFLKGRAGLGAQVQGYVNARVIVAALTLLGHLAGVLYQRPRILLALGCVEAVVMWALVRAVRRRAATARAEAQVAPAGT